MDLTLSYCYILHNIVVRVSCGRGYRPAACHNIVVRVSCGRGSNPAACHNIVVMGMLW